ncbi:hypothetical protein [Micromonospora sp. CB01531]|uniref:hypothetical protein n=1 Tax=Micromonospora sp. CB01531 TaxID=1718947 RepID=UPI00093E4E4D|nr:hypothetical protein [Micromonospora sp. CB01531]OKI64029.1 hypothetical protein A6A27_26295 [Micromonospora sp. CB01531]
MTDMVSGAPQSIHAERPAGTRAILALHGLLAAGYLLGAGITALVAAVRSGHYEGLLSPGLDQFDDPKVYLPPVGPDSLWNPLTWIFSLTHLIAIFIRPLAAVAGLLGLLHLLRAGVRGHRRAAGWLAVGTAVSFALLAISLTPYGSQMQAWLLD